MRCLLWFGTLIFVFAVSNSAVVAQYDGFKQAKVLYSPTVEKPKEAKETGFGGKVNVRVSVDETGKVTGIEAVGGPGSVCASVTRPDVVAMRRVAAEAAMKTQFSPATRYDSPEKSTAWIGFEFPIQSNDKSDGDRKYVASGGSTGDGDSKGVLNHKAISLPKPAYPPAARAVRASGLVVIQVLIDEDGTIFSAEVVSGNPLLRAASTRAVCEAKFAPTVLDGKPVKVPGIITYNFVP